MPRAGARSACAICLPRASLPPRLQGVRYDFSRQRVDAMTLRLLANLADERGFPEWREALLSGKPINSTEKRAAWHTALRAGASAPPEVRETLARMRAMATKLRAERHSRGSSTWEPAARISARACSPTRWATARSKYGSPPTPTRATWNAPSKAPIRRPRCSSSSRRPSPRRKRCRTPHRQKNGEGGRFTP